MKDSKQAFSEMYVFLLVVLFSMFLVFVVNGYEILTKNNEAFEMHALYMKQKAIYDDFSLKLHTQWNRDGIGENGDQVFCPKDALYGTSVIATQYVLGGGNTGFCYGTGEGITLTLFMNASGNDFLSGTLNSSGFMLAWSGSRKVALVDGKMLAFTQSLLKEVFSGSFVDNQKYDRFDGREDNDGKIYDRSVGVAQNTWNFLFWNGKENRDRISLLYETGGVRKDVGNVATGKVFLGIDGTVDIQVVLFDRRTYEEEGVLIAKKRWVGESITQSGYLMLTTTGVEMRPSVASGSTFSFKDEDYGLFIKSSGTGGNVWYELRIYEETGGAVVPTYMFAPGISTLFEYNGKYIITHR